MEFISKSLEDTKKIAVDFANSPEDGHQGNKATVVGLYGDLGAGKTTFMKYFAEALGIEEIIQSPTFVIERVYKIPNLEFGACDFEFLIHIDAYRLDKAEELLNLGWQDIINDPKNLICIEWPERVSEIMPPHIMVRFEHYEEGRDQNSRKISIT